MATLFGYCCQADAVLVEAATLEVQLQEWRCTFAATCITGGWSGDRRSHATANTVLALGNESVFSH